MKRSLLVVLLFGAVFTVNFLMNGNDLSGSVTKVNEDCCMDIQVSDKNGSRVACDLIILEGVNEIARASTDNNGVARFCDLVKGNTYTVRICDECRDDPAMSFVACEKDRVGITCF